MFSMSKSNLSKRKNQLLETKEVAVRDLRAHRIKQEKSRRALWREKLYMLIGLAILYHVWSRMLTIERLRNAQVKADTISEETRNIGLMHSKRFFSPEIKIEHSIAVKESENEYPTYTYTQDHGMDRVHLILPYEGGLLKYKKEYFATLLELFPSMHGYVSIWSDKEDSFFSFINSPDVEEHKHKILASLLLLAEGVNVPLAIDESQKETELILKKADRRKEHFRLNMNVFVKTRKDGIESLDVLEWVFQKQAVDVVNFFIENRENKVFSEKEDCSDPPHCKELEKVQFVNSPAFLMQTYIQHCLESTKEVVLFIQAVCDLLREGMSQKEESSREKGIEKAASYLICKYMEKKECILLKKGMTEKEKASFRKLFKQNHLRKYLLQKSYFIRKLEKETPPIKIEQIDITNMQKRSLHNDYIDCNRDFLHLEPATYILPAKNNSIYHSPNITRLSKSDSNSNTVLEKNAEFTSHGATALLGLFCYIAYDCKKHIYTVDHIESASEKLKSFFQKHKNMYGVVSKEVHDDWNQVVEGLSNPNIRYLGKGKKQIAPGIINMLYVIKEITGVGDTEEIDAFRKKLNFI
ncbi:hypothetical protein NEAUS03_1958, partial [Nematocida ausubeli]